jgi:hypothetical protein
MADTRLTRWVLNQLRTVDGDKGFRAAKICFERPDGSIVETWSTDTTNLDTEIADRLAAQSEELPTGPHPYKMVAYGPDNVQMSELPQTLRGRCRDATGAATEAMAMQRAVALTLENAQSAVVLLRQECERRADREAVLQEDLAAALNKVHEISSNNFEQELRFQQFMRSSARMDQFIENMSAVFTPLLTMAVEKYGPMLMEGAKNAARPKDAKQSSNATDLDGAQSGAGKAESSSGGGLPGNGGAGPRSIGDRPSGVGN